MKNLELEQMGVLELNAVEMNETQGGVLAIILGIVIGLCMMDAWRDGEADR